MEKFCQSCGMPLSEEVLGKNLDGSKSEDYCCYCYKDGEFTSDVTMEEMIEVCVPFEVEAGMKEEDARKRMKEYFPTLKRWEAVK